MKRAILDNLLFIWDENDFLKNNYIYYQLSEVAISAIKFIKEHEIVIYITPEVRELLINSFPVQSLEKNLNLDIFVAEVLSFLSDYDNFISDIQLQEDSLLLDVIIKPKSPLSNVLEIYDIIYQMYFCALRLGIKQLISSNIIWPDNSKLSVYVNGNALDYIYILRSNDEWLSAFVKKRIYEPSLKHHYVYGWGTPVYLPPDIVQAYLETAISATEDIDERVLYNVCDGQIIVFRCHSVGRYHCYFASTRYIPVEVLRVFTSKNLLQDCARTMKRKI